MMCIWVGFLVLLLAMRPNPFLLWAQAGGGVLIAEHIYSVVYRGKPSEGNIVIAGLMLVFLAVSGICLRWVTSVTPVLHDAQLERLDFGISSSVRMWAMSHWWVFDPLAKVYEALPFFVLLCVMFAHGMARRRLLYSIILAAFLALPCYMLYPAVGPVHVGDPNAFRNCMPSMHLTWALMLWINSRGWARWAFGVIAVLTAVATLTTGEHYVLDLVAALPWTWLLTLLAGKIAGWSGVRRVAG
jgi:hypothetical protein